MIDPGPCGGEQLQFRHVLQQSRVDGDLGVDSDSGFAELGRVGQGGAIGDYREECGKEKSGTLTQESRAMMWCLTAIVFFLEAFLLGRG